MESWRKTQRGTDLIIPSFSFLCNTSDHLSLIAVCIVKNWSSWKSLQRDRTASRLYNSVDILSRVLFSPSPSVSIEDRVFPLNESPVTQSLLLEHDR